MLNELGLHNFDDRTCKLYYVTSSVFSVAYKLLCRVTMGREYAMSNKIVRFLGYTRLYVGYVCVHRGELVNDDYDDD